MKTTIENINGKQYTMIHHTRHSALGRRFAPLNNGVLEFFKDADCTQHVATALPPLPRHPTKENVALLHLYAAHGVELDFEKVSDRTWSLGFCAWLADFFGNKGWKTETYEITHAIYNGERVEVAME